MCSALIFDCFRWMFMFFGIQHVPRSCEELNDAEVCLANGVRDSILEKMGASRKKKQDLPKQELRFVTAFTGEASCSSIVAMEHSCSRAVPPLVVRTGSSLCKASTPECDHPPWALHRAVPLHRVPTMA